MYTDDYKYYFSRNICYLRETHHLSKRAMAKLLGISIKSLSLLEAGTIPPRMTINVLRRIFAVFHVTPHTMFSILLEQAEF